MNSADHPTDLFLELETSLHKRHVRNSPEAVSGLLADDFLEFGSSGRVWDKPAIVESLRHEAWGIQAAVEDFKVRELAADIALVTYVAKAADSSGTLRSSIWKRMDGRWRMVFHQGTRIP
jgi:hypothetical protein